MMDDWYQTVNDREWDAPEQMHAQRLAEGREPGWSDRDETSMDYVTRMDRLAQGLRPVEIGGAS